ncbi:hypothetical protein NMG29_38660 [Streptomyces cocklensis]|uniref:Rod shape-determining protein MreC n=1 Tax=Actinacidiphila cocklensis TaxID=887465 RepID=A0A9W4EBF4_9ACTN|nr:hypothetical protein [Actinacidiphila cocklensis]MDD1064018.1 hypothetical protein [Actinacidiphila cocklensis]CAG6398686.1 Rod shape-determining protein MreC [Actinacidiphila cocklensis]
MNVNNARMQAIAMVASACLAGMTVGTSAATAAEPTSVTAVSLPHMPAASQAAPSSSPGANSPTPQAIQESGGQSLASIAPHAASPAKCIIMWQQAQYALFVEKRTGDTAPASYAVTDI